MWSSTFLNSPWVSLDHSLAVCVVRSHHNKHESVPATRLSLSVEDVGRGSNEFLFFRLSDFVTAQKGETFSVRSPPVPSSGFVASIIVYKATVQSRASSSHREVPAPSELPIGSPKDSLRPQQRMWSFSLAATECGQSHGEIVRRRPRLPRSTPVERPAGGNSSSPVPRVPIGFSPSVSFVPEALSQPAAPPDSFVYR